MRFFARVSVADAGAHGSACFVPAAFCGWGCGFCWDLMAGVASRAAARVSVVFVFMGAILRQAGRWEKTNDVTSFGQVRP